jgi:pimeloyl-ACP methyl ester carboxylesterase
MIGKEFLSDQRYVTTPSGTIGYVERGTGTVALFVHGVLLDGYFWRNQLANLADLRRCIAVDLLGHGVTTTVATQDMSVTANAKHTWSQGLR